MDKKPVAAARRLVYWLVVVAALAAAGCWGVTRESVLGRLPQAWAIEVRMRRDHLRQWWQSWYAIRHPIREELGLPPE